MSKNQDFIKSECSFTGYKNQRLAAICFFKKPGCYIVFGTEVDGGASRHPHQILCLSLAVSMSQAQSFLDTGAFAVD
jgi:hypothetical protein